jgi:hypothetical protein
VFWLGDREGGGGEENWQETRVAGSLIGGQRQGRPSHPQVQDVALVGCLPYSEEDERENKSWIFWRCWVGLVVLKRRWAEKEARMKKGAEPFF